MYLALDRPTSAAATDGGLRLAETPHPMRVVGAMLDARAVHPRRTAGDHLAAVARAGGVARSRVAPTLERVGLGAVGDRAAGDFSQGM
jgi:ABC-2 type transport system ATP-binding protein